MASSFGNRSAADSDELRNRSSTNQDDTNTRSRNENQMVVSAPKLAKNRYSREEFLALYPSAVNFDEPNLRNSLAQYFIEKRQEPVSLEPFTAMEQQLLFQSVNSTRALSLAKRMEPKPSPPVESVGSGDPIPPTQPIRAAGVGRGFIRSSATAMSTGQDIIPGVGRGRGVTMQGRGTVSVGSASSVGGMATFSRTTPTLTPTSSSDWQTAPQPRSGSDTQSPQSNAPSAVNFASQPTEIPDEKVNGRTRWCYIDPVGDMRGPFESSDMAEWFALGYFTMQLMIRREEENGFMRLGDLIKQSGRVPFVRGASDKNANRETGSSVGSRSRATSGSSAVDGIVRPVPVYGRASNSPNVPKGISEISASAGSPIGSSVDQGFGKETNDCVDQLDALGNNISPHKSSVGSSVESEMLPIFPQPQEEIAQSQPQRIQPSGADLLRAKFAFLKERLKQDIERKRLEEERQQKEAEEFRKAEERQRLQEEQLQRLREQIKAEQEIERKRLDEERRVEEEAERRRRIQEEEERKRQERERRRLQEQRRMAAVLAEEERLRNLRIQEESGRVAPARPAPWADQDPPSQPTPAPFYAPPVQSLTEILAEEERQMRAEKRQDVMLGMKKRQDVNQGLSSGAWKAPTKSDEHEEGLWSTDFMSDSRPKMTSSKKNNGTPIDAFTKWCLIQVEALNSDIDAAVMVEYLKGIDSPSDVTECITAYFGDSGPAKEFLDAFLQRRQQQTSLSSNCKVSSRVRSVPDQPPAKNRKKTGKGTKMIVDGAALGFKSAADSKRLNVACLEQHPSPFQ